MGPDLTFAELPQLANMNRDAAGVDISLRRAGFLGQTLMACTFLMQIVFATKRFVAKLGKKYQLALRCPWNSDAGPMPSFETSSTRTPRMEMV